MATSATVTRNRTASTRSDGRGLHGYVAELGACNGLNFAHYPPRLSELAAHEPEPYWRACAELAANAPPVEVSLRDGLAETAPLEAASFDAGVASSMLCSVADLALALSELRRVLRPRARAALLRPSSVAAAGFRVNSPRSVELGPPWLHTNLWVLGTARA